MKLNKVKKMANELIKEYKLDKYGWTFSFDNAIRRRGCCHYRKKKITLSKELTKLIDEKNVRDTILHEIAHALTKKDRGHGSLWKSWAIAIGCNGNRLASDGIRLKPKYVSKCPKCDKECTGHRSVNVSCRKCCDMYNEGKYSEDFKLVWRKNDN